MKMMAHRGDTTTAFGNTMEAFRSAVDIGVHGFEFDVRLTSDHVPVVYHNMMFKTDTETGFVSDYTHQEVQSFIKTVNGVPYRIPSLQDVLDEFCGKTYLEIHMICDHPQMITSIGQLLLSYRQHWDMLEVTSFEPAILLGFHEQYKDMRCDLLFQWQAWMTDEMAIRILLDKAQLAQATGVHLPVKYVTVENVKRFNGAGFAVDSSIINDLETFKSIKSSGIDMFSTDNCHLFIET